MSTARFLTKKPSVTRAALLALTAGLSLGASVAQAQVVDSGLLATPITVPNTSAGIYLNVLTGATGATSAGTPGWDFNPWGSTTAPAGMSLFWPAPATSGGVSTAGVYDNMAVGAAVGPASTFIQTTTPASAANLRLGGTVYVGMRFLNETGSTLHYGFVQMTTTAPTGFPAQIVRYVFNATPNTAVTITAPGGGGPPPVTPSVPVNATSTWSLIALMLALFGFAAVAVRRQG